MLGEERYEFQEHLILDIDLPYALFYVVFHNFGEFALLVLGAA
jgi:hypothetical protein